MRLRIGLTLVVVLAGILVRAQPPTTTTAESERARWNRVFNSAPPNIRTEANRFLVQVVSELPPGTALDVGMGFGRNALFLAEHGWTVTGVDISDVGVAKAQEQATARHLPLTAVRADMFSFDYGHDRYDLVVFAYMGGEQNGMAGRITETLKPGGLLVIEHFLKEGSMRIGYAAGTLPKLYPRLEVLRYAEVESTPDYGQQQSGRVVQFLARKPK